MNWQRDRDHDNDHANPLLALPPPRPCDGLWLGCSDSAFRPVAHPGDPLRCPRTSEFDSWSGRPAKTQLALLGDLPELICCSRQGRRLPPAEGMLRIEYPFSVCSRVPPRGFALTSTTQRPGLRPPTARFSPQAHAVRSRTASTIRGVAGYPSTCAPTNPSLRSRLQRQLRPV